MNRQATTDDFEFIYGLYMHPDINPWLLYEQMEKEEFKAIFNELESRGQLFIFQCEDEDAGMFKLVPMKHRNSHIVYLGGVALDPTFKGRGLGELMLREVVEKVKDQGHRRIELTVATFNKNAVSLYEKIGFQNEGRLKDYTYLKSEDRYIDEYVMGLVF
jgi:RimJ/RimL family protein N-acetyltransferase